MQTKLSLSKLMVFQGVGFLTIIGLSWFVELTDLRTLLLGNHPYISDFRESVLEMLLVLAVWLLVNGSSRRLLERVSYLEGFMRICSWCHHIHFKGKWISMEEFMQQGFDTPTTHGICPTCLERQKAMIEGRAMTRPKPSEQGQDDLPPQWRKAADQADSVHA